MHLLKIIICVILAWSAAGPAVLLFVKESALTTFQTGLVGGPVMWAFFARRELMNLGVSSHAIGIAVAVIVGIFLGISIFLFLK